MHRKPSVNPWQEPLRWLCQCKRPSVRHEWTWEAVIMHMGYAQCPQAKEGQKRRPPWNEVSRLNHGATQNLFSTFQTGHLFPSFLNSAKNFRPLLPQRLHFFFFWDPTRTEKTELAPDFHWGCLILEARDMQSKSKAWKRLRETGSSSLWTEKSFSTTWRQRQSPASIQTAFIPKCCWVCTSQDLGGFYWSNVLNR